jgi:hypothetical protein
MGEVAKSGSSVCFVCRYAEQAQCAHLPPKMHWKLITLINIGRKRRDAFSGEAAHSFAQGVYFGAKGKIQTRIVHLTRLGLEHQPQRSYRDCGITQLQSIMTYQP